MVDGVQQKIPKMVGFAGPQAPNPNCLYPLHTHDRTGILHVEFPAPTRVTLGQFFEIWGQTLSNTEVAGITNPSIVFWIDEGGVVTQYTGDPKEIELRPNRGITIQIGTPITEIPTYRL